ncbi:MULTISPECIES: LppU/SCO3897 family protein [unclassified Saccharothrix]|uniref:LppU/SCO3897 family protein n=1 Tax=unclassified Saccharothrix TaxID=2593673 RepID=UPI00307F4B01
MSDEPSRPEHGGETKPDTTNDATTPEAAPGNTAPGSEPIGSETIVPDPIVPQSNAAPSNVSGSSAADAEPPAGEAAASRYLVTPDDEDAAPAPASADGGAKRKVLISVLAVVAVAAIAVAGYFVLSERATADAGDCVSIGRQDENNRADVKTLDCDEDDASYKVGKVLDKSDDACPEEGLYTEVSPADGEGDGYKLCLLPNMSEGACYKPDDGTGFVKTECTGPETIKVTKVIQDSVDLSQCPDSAGMSYPEPKVTYCLAPAEL